MSKIRRNLTVANNLIDTPTNINAFLLPKTRFYTTSSGSITRLYFVLKVKNYNSWSIKLNVNPGSIIKFGLQIRRFNSEDLVNTYLQNYNEYNPMPTGSGMFYNSTEKDEGWILGGMERCYNNTNTIMNDQKTLIIASTYISTNRGFPTTKELLNNATLEINNLEFY